MATSSIQSNCDSTIISDNDKRHANMKWDEIGFGLTPTDYMYMMKSTNEGKFSSGHLATYGNIELSPSSAVLNYGQGLIEGLKVYRREDDGIMLFRPDQNALRMQMGAKRLLMPSPSIDQFVDAVKQIAIANKRWVPPHGKGTLYVRPILFGSGAVLGVAPAPQCTFLISASPIGNYFKHEKSLDLLIVDGLHRASPGGTGSIKCITNYSPVFESVTEAKANGYSDVLFLDVTTGKYIEEVSSCNVFIVKGNIVSTPATKGTVLPGITRKSIMEIALDSGYEVEEREIPVEDVLDADEVFCTGTAVIVTTVGSITYKDERVEYRTGKETVSNKLRATLTGIQTGLIEDTKGWTVSID